MSDSYHKYPRLYIDETCAQHVEVILSLEHTHYLKNVMRKNIGDCVRVFNGRDGEWIATIFALDKRVGTIRIDYPVRAQSPVKRTVKLFFAPLQKKRMDMVIEKAVELGVTDLYPVISHRTEHRDVNMDRVRAQIIEASEQAERLNIATLHAPQMLDFTLSTDHGVPLYACVARSDRPMIPLSQVDISRGGGFLIGPAGGFDDDEVAQIEQRPYVTPISLGDNILRAETAAIMCMVYAAL